MKTTLPASEQLSLIDIINKNFAFFKTDKSGHIIELNQYFCDLMEYKKEELIGKNSRFLKSGIHSESFYKNLWTTILSGQTWRGIICNKAKNGRLIWGDTIISPIFYDSLNKSSESIIGFLVLRSDVTENAANELILREQEKQLIMSSKYSNLGEMLSFLAHEIKSPLATAYFINDKIKSIAVGAAQDQKIIELTDKIKSIFDKVNRLVDVVRQYARQNENEELEIVEPDFIISQALQVIGPLIQNSGIHFSVENKNENRKLVKCNLILFSHVIINLIQNSIQSISEKNPITLSPWIKIIIEGYENNLLIRVVDSGEGIPDPIAKRLFEPQFTTKNIKQGTGLGLKVSKKIIEKLAGNLTYELYEGRTSFKVQVPCSP